MIKLDTTISNNALDILTNAFNGVITDRRAMTGTKTAFMSAAHYLRKDWADWARGAKLQGAEDIKNPNPKLAASIQVAEITPFRLEVGTNSLYMKRIVEGQKAFDMKETYPFGEKSRRRVDKDGNVHGYLIIPFRWGTPGKNGAARAHFRNVIPPNVYNLVKRFKTTVVEKETHLEANYRGKLIERREYTWGDRLKSENVENINGLVRMDNRGGYFTFRIITEKNMLNANKWWKKAVAPNDVPNALIRKDYIKIEQIIQEGIKADLGQD